MHPDWIITADLAILEHLQEHPPEYVPLVANRTGLHLKLAERRFDRLEQAGLIMPVTNESIFTITKRGLALVDPEEYDPADARSNGSIPADV
jgi:predicted transcriptional regulator